MTTEKVRPRPDLVDPLARALSERASTSPRVDAPPQVAPASAWNIPNALTVVRILLVPVFAVVLFVDDGHRSGWRVLAWGVFALAATTDVVDGRLARRRNSVTAFGKLADPIADKALTGTTLVGLSLLGDLPWLVTAVIIVREVGVTALRFWVIRHGVIAASRGGKVKTLLQNISLGLYVLPLSGLFGTLRAVVLTAAVAITVVTGLDYLTRALTLRQVSERAAVKRARRAARVQR